VDFAQTTDDEVRGLLAPRVGRLAEWRKPQPAKQNRGKRAMKQEAHRGGWGVFIEEFSRQNRMRPTRLAEIKVGEVMEDYWLEDGLPLTGIDLDTHGKGAPTLEIMLGVEGETGNNMTHTVDRVQKIKLQLTVDGQDDGLEIEDAGGVTTILRFESLPR
jgi:hypothetical protein